MATKATQVDVAALFRRDTPKWDPKASQRTADVYTGVNQLTAPYTTLQNLKRKADVKERGQLIAMRPDNRDAADILYFSRFPRDMKVKFAAGLGKEEIPGRAFPVFQWICGKGATIEVELFFYDAWLSIPDISGRTTRPKAAVASVWFERYVQSGDNTGAMVQPAEIYFILGNNPPVRVLIDSVDIEQGMFISEEGSHIPQSVAATVKMQRHEPVELVSPYRPRQLTPRDFLFEAQGNATGAKSSTTPGGPDQDAPSMRSLSDRANLRFTREEIEDLEGSAWYEDAWYEEVASVWGRVLLGEGAPPADTPGALIQFY